MPYREAKCHFDATKTLPADNAPAAIPRRYHLIESWPYHHHQYSILKARIGIIV